MRDNVVACCALPVLPVMVRVNVPRGVFGLVATVSFELAPLPPGTTLEGAKLHDAKAGAPVHVSATVALTVPPTGSTLTVAVPDLARLTRRLAGLTPTEKSMPMPLKLTVGLVVVIPSEPDTVRAPLRDPVAEGVNVTLYVQEFPPAREFTRAASWKPPYLNADEK